MRYRLLTSLIVCSLGILPSGPGYGRGDTVTPESGKHSSVPGAVAVTTEDSPLYRVHANSHFRLTATNWGYFGNFNGDLIDSSTLDLMNPLPSPGLESPPFSQIDYLYEAGFWVGGIVGEDTMVSVGTVEWPPTFEMHPGDDSPPVYTDTLGDEEFTSVYFDTLTDPAIVRADAIDGVHRPLPIRVRQTTRLVDDTDFDKGMILEVTVTNTGVQTINGLWLGWYVDCDIRHPDHNRSWLHDISGYHDTTVTIDGTLCVIQAAWSADNDGDPDTLTGFDAASPRSVMGAMYLGGTPALPDESFNWWNIGFTRSYDWGPSRNPSDTNAAGGYGRVLGDAVKYRRMSNQEIDYDQVYAATDRTAGGWIPPTTTAVAENFANGYDTRFMQTRGAVDLAPGDSIVAVWAWVLAEDFHRDPDHFTDTFDPLDPSAYMAGLNFATLDTALARMKILWNGQFSDATVGSPKRFAVFDWDDSTASMTWTPRGTHRLDHYEIYHSFDPGVFAGPPVGIVSRGDSIFSDAGLARDKVHYYIIRSIDDQGRLGTASAVIDVLPDRPETPIITRIVRGDAQIRLEWAPPLEPDVVAHRLYRRDGDVWDLLGETYLPGSVLDVTVNNAQVYEYRLGAISALGSESYLTDPAWGVAFAFDGPPLLIDHTLSAVPSLTTKDSVAVVWQRLTAPLGGAYRDADPETTFPFGLDVYNPHPAILVVSDGREALRPEADGQLGAYDHAGGVSILSGRDLFNDDVITEGPITFGSGDRPYDNYGITAAYYPRVLLSHPTRPNAEFISARSNVAWLPDLGVDASRTDWGLNPALPKPGDAVPFVGYFEIDTARAEAVYSYVSRDSLNSESHGKAVGIISKVPGVHGAVLAFPVSYMQEAGAALMVSQLLRHLGWVGNTPADLNGDGIIASDDLAMMIDYVFGYGSLNNVNNADINGDCQVNLIDVVILINYLFFGGPTLVPGCVGV